MILPYAKRWWFIVFLFTSTALSAGFLLPARWLTGQSFCGFRLATGTGCPGCGMTRSITSLLKGDLQRSIEMHAFGPVLAVVAAWLWMRALAALLSRDPAPLDVTRPGWLAGLVVFLVLYMGYWLLRVAMGSTP